MCNFVIWDDNSCIEILFSVACFSISFLTSSHKSFFLKLFYQWHLLVLIFSHKVPIGNKSCFYYVQWIIIPVTDKMKAKKSYQFICHFESFSLKCEASNWERQGRKYCFLLLSTKKFIYAQHLSYNSSTKTLSITWIGSLQGSITEP